MGRIAVVFTGGTIAMRASAAGGNVPVLRGAELLATVVAVVTVVAYGAYTWTAPNLPANHAMVVTVPLVPSRRRFCPANCSARPANAEKAVRVTSRSS